MTSVKSAKASQKAEKQDEKTNEYKICDSENTLSNSSQITDAYEDESTKRSYSKRQVIQFINNSKLNDLR